MRDRICIVCGEKAEHGNFCKEHYLEREKLAELPKTLELNRCKECFKFNISGRLKPIDEESAIIESLDNMTNLEDVEDIEINKVNDTKLEITMKGEIEESAKEETHKIQYRLTNRLCEDCTKRRGRYYEGVIQLRPKSLKALRMIIDDESIVEIQELKEGFNILVITKKDLRRLVNTLKPITKEKKESYTIIGVDKSGKQLSRTTMLLRIEEEK